MKRRLVQLSRPVLELLAEGINPAELLKPVLTEVVDVKGFILSAEHVPCPRCNGTGRNPERDAVCGLCDGAGCVLKERAEALAKIKRDISQRLLRRRADESVDAKDFIMQQDPTGVYGWVCRVKEGVTKGKFFPSNTDSVRGFTPYIGYAKVFKRKSTWLTGWPDYFKRGYWEVLPVFSDPRKTGERALTGEAPRKYNFRPMPEVEESLTPAEDLATSLILESPQFKTLKKARRSLSEPEREQAAGAPVWKAEVGGTIWYCSNTHRCYQAHKSLSAAVKAYHEVVEPSG